MLRLKPFFISSPTPEQTNMPHAPNENNALEQAVKELKGTQIRSARRFAVQFIYSLDLNQEILWSDRDFEIFVQQMQIPAEYVPFIRLLCKTVLENLQKIDQLIQTHCRNWKLHRINKVDLAILRVTVCELLYRPKLPIEIIIADAAEIGKEFSTEHAHSFVNGVLDGVARSIRSTQRSQESN